MIHFNKGLQQCLFKEIYSIDQMMTQLDTGDDQGVELERSMQEGPEGSKTEVCDGRILYKCSDPCTAMLITISRGSEPRFPQMSYQLSVLHVLLDVSLFNFNRNKITIQIHIDSFMFIISVKNIQNSKAVLSISFLCRQKGTRAPPAEHILAFYFMSYLCGVVFFQLNTLV